MSEPCGCDDLCRDLSLLTGDKGDPGTAGRDGTFGANSDLWQFNAAVVGNPGNGFLLFNNASLSAATSINVSNVDSTAITVTTWLAALNTSNATVKGFIRVNKEFDDTSFAMYSVSAYTANAGYGTFTIAFLGGSSNSPFTANDNVIFSYVISGNNGAAGVAGTTILYNNCVSEDSGNTGGVPFAFPGKVYNIPALTFVNNGDCVTIIAQNECTDTTLPGSLNIDSESLQIGNNGVLIFFSGYAQYSNNFQSREFKVELNRTSASSLRATFHCLDNNNVNMVYDLDMAGLDFTLVTNVTMYGISTVATVSLNGYVTAKRLFIESKKI